MRGTLTRAGLLVAVLAASLVVEAADEVKTRRGVSRGRVKADNVKGVLLRPPEGGEITIPASEIIEVTYERAPLEYDFGVSRFERKRYDEAIKLLQKALRNQDRPQLLKQYILFYMARSYEGLKQYRRAEQMYNRLTDEVPDSRFGPQVHKLLLNMYLDSKQYGKIRRLIPKIRQTNPTRAKLVEALIYEREGKYSRARELYTILRNSGGRAGAEAQVGIARCLLHQKKYRRAQTEAERAIHSSEELPPSVYAQAHLVIGNAAYEQAGSSKKRYKKALFSFLRIPLLYGGDMETEPEALYKAGRCFEAIKSKPRARTMYQRAIKRYRNTSWGKKCKERMSGVR